MLELSYVPPGSEYVGGFEGGIPEMEKCLKETVKMEVKDLFKERTTWLIFFPTLFYII